MFAVVELRTRHVVEDVEELVTMECPNRVRVRVMTRGPSQSEVGKGTCFGMRSGIVPLSVRPYIGCGAVKLPHEKLLTCVVEYGSACRPKNHASF